VHNDPEHLHHDYAEAYDIAFDWRDLQRDCDSLDAIYRRFSGQNREPQAFLDVCCGPGFHCLQYALHGRRSFGLDLSEAMIGYAQAKAKRLGSPAEFVHADMRDFHLPEPVDIAFCPMGSFHYLLSNDDIVRHLRSVARNLRPGGIYVIEANHPRHVFRMERPPMMDWGTRINGSVLPMSWSGDWEAERNGTRVRFHWGSDDGGYDPIAQIATSRVRIEMINNGSSRVWEFKDPDRYLTHQELLLLIEKSDALEPVAWLGGLDLSRTFDNSDKSSWMVPVLRRK
jgi:SAM-dependent methyltransferase